MEDLLGKRKKPIRAEVPLCLDSMLSQERGEAEEALKAARTKLAEQEAIAKLQREGDGLAPSEFYDEEFEAKEALAAAVAAAEAETVVFEFRALGGKELEDLYKEYAPTDMQRAEFKEGLKKERLSANNKLSYDPVRFPPALISKSLLGVRPLGAPRSKALKISPEEAAEMWNSDVWSEGERTVLLGTAEGVNKIIAE